MDISKTDILAIERLLSQCSSTIEKYAPAISPDQDLCRRCKKMNKKLNKKIQKHYGYAHVV